MNIYRHPKITFQSELKQNKLYSSQGGADTSVATYRKVISSQLNPNRSFCDKT